MRLGFDRGLLLSLLLFCALAAAVKLYLRDRAAAAPLRSSVRAVRRLPAYTRVTAADVRAVRDTRTVPPGAATDPREIVGRVLTAPADSGAVLSQRESLDLVGEWVILSLAGDSTLAGRPGDAVTLLGGIRRDSVAADGGMRRDSTLGAASVVAISLGLRGGKTHLALRPQDLQRVASYYQRDSRFLAVRQIPATPVWQPPPRAARPAKRPPA